ncbi:hypothetical protein PFICI_04735 [Pestalotiopsis fici W106-1]|uniref:Histone deacetylase domain-containing protein n=1 Tax=Pestalotiopsis fici (strain W106-1 / CGMCC3.15140) TaxID=1229662 RepID=W3XA04_PESFW|nr:uncharacterized protein PFICI_04735 [Pestalotiopsis fici W106-1]ETS82859.1 hypothetical protein PFICI_04735 [Pestalotiopsis fici W106-1]
MAAPGGSGGQQANNPTGDASLTTNNINTGADADLLRSLNQLSLSTPDTRSPSRASSTSPHPARTVSRLDHLTVATPSQRRSSTSKSPASHIQTPTRSSTPTLLRKASTNSLHSANGGPVHRAPSRRSSSALHSPTFAKLTGNGSSQHAIEEDVRFSKTEADVAREYFIRELDIHHISNPDPRTETLVILQDACYNHRYQRPFAGKGNLATIVERPERLQAVYTGVAMAYVRLGERHQDGKAPIDADLDPSTLQVPFDIRKTERKLSLNAPAVTNVHGAKWMEELAILCNAAEAKLQAGSLEIQRPEMDRGHGAKAPEPFHKGDLYLSPESLSAFEGALGATCEAVDAVFSTSATKRVFVAVRPPGHHCDTSFPHGFCWLNNVHVGIMHGFLNHGLTHAAIIDFDLHHGDGSQDIAWEYNQRKHWSKGNAAQWKKSSIGYFSLHDIQSYPCEQGDLEAVKKASLCIEDAFSQTIWNVHLQQWKDHADFWYQYRTRITIVLEKARAFLRRETEKCRAAGQEPRAAIFFSAGFDASEFESAGMQRHKVNVPTEFYARISRDVVKMSFEEGLSVDGRIVSCLEGGYSDRALSSGVLAHLSGLAGGDVRAKEDAALGHSRNGSRRISLSASPLGRRGTISSVESDARSKAPGFPYDSSWWSVPELDRLDAARFVPKPQPRPVREGPVPTYCSPTQSSNAKVTELAKLRRTVSGLSNADAATHVVARAPTPPPPLVYWPSAALELSRLLIPVGGQVDSITWDALKSEETRIKREQKEIKDQKEREKLRLSSSPSDQLIDGSGTPALRKSGRERKPVSYAEPEDPNKHRRRTVAGAAILATDKAAARGTSNVAGSTHNRHPSRRLSASSAISTMTADTAVPYVPTVEPSLGVPARPGTAQTDRPDTSLSIRTTPGPLSVPKTRPVASRKDSTKSTGTNARKSKPAASKAPRKDAKSKGLAASRSTAQSSNLSSPVRPPGNQLDAGSSTEAARASSTATPDSGNDISNITSGMKKIKINVVTKEMKEAREKAAKERESATATPVLENHPTPLEQSSSTPTDNVPVGAEYENDQLPGVDSNNADSAPAIEQAQPLPVTPQKENQPVDMDMDLPEQPPTDVPITPVHDPQTIDEPQDSALFIPYQPEGPPAQAIPQTAPTKWVTPNTVETPVPYRGHNFTATSAIPFSPAKPIRADTPMSKNSSVFGRQVPFASNKPANHNLSAFGNDATATSGHTEPGSSEDAKTWDPTMEIPETPEHKRP